MDTRGSGGNLGQLYQHEKSKYTRYQKRKQTRTHGKFNLQLEEILTLFHQKTKYFSPSYFLKTREVLCFCKNGLSRLHNLKFKHPKF